MVSINIIPPPPFCRGGLKLWSILKKGEAETFLFFSEGMSHKAGMVFCRGARGFSIRQFQPMIKYFILWSQDNKVFSLLTLVKFSSYLLSFLSFYLKWQCFKSCPYLLDFKSHAFWTLWVWQAGMFGVKIMLCLFKT